MAALLPTGRCNYRNLERDVTCGCQKFWAPRRKGKGKRAVRDGDAADDDDDDEGEEEKPCACGHHACFHAFEPPANASLPTSANPETLRPQAPTPAHEAAQPDDASRRAASTRRLSVQTTASGYDTASLHSHNPALSAASGTTTERDPSSTTTSASTPIFRPQFYAPQYPPHRHGPPPTSASLEALPPAVLHHHQNPAPPKRASSHKKSSTLGSRPGTASTAMTSASAPGKLSSRQLLYLVDTVGQINERLEIVEGLAPVLENVQDRVDLLEETGATTIDDRVGSFEKRIDNRLQPVESYIRASGKKRKQRQIAREPDDDRSSARDRKRIRVKSREKESSEEITSQLQREITTTTTTSFISTTSTSASFSSPGVSRGRADEATTSRIVSLLEQLETRMGHIERVIPPSKSKPFELEVVLVPPCPLRGVWFDPSGSMPSTQHDGSEHSSAAPTVVPGGASNPQELGISPRSMSVSSRIYKRLQSRGFVKHILIPDTPAFIVSMQIELNFGHLLDWCRSFSTLSSPTADQSSSQRSPKPFGKKWQPLRKVYQQTLLEFLSPEELNWPLWNLDFLRGTCIMRGSRKVLYIITPGIMDSTMTWDDIRDLGTNQDGSDESCWEFDHKLDSKPFIPGSLFGSSPFGPFAEEPPLDVSFRSHASRVSRASQLQQQATPPDTAPQNVSTSMQRMRQRGRQKEKEVRRAHSASAATRQPGSRYSPSLQSPPMSYPTSFRKRMSGLSSNGSLISAMDSPEVSISHETVGIGGWQDETGEKQIKEESDRVSDKGGLYDDQLDISGFFESHAGEQEEPEEPEAPEVSVQPPIAESFGMDGGYQSA